MSSVGNISLDLNVNSRNFNRQVDGIGRHAKKSFGFVSVAIGNIFADMAQRAVGSIGNFVKESIDKGSELSELQNVVDSVFTTMADKVDTFSKGALEAYGLTETQSKKMIGTFGAMSKSFGYSEKQAYAMSTALTALAGDVASFYNLDHNEAYTKLKSVYTGETESLKELGVVMTQTALDQFALANGFGKTTKNMSEQEKVALRLAFVQDKLSVAAGDFTKTQSQWANQTRILSGQFESLKAAIGEGLINVLTPVIRIINTIMAKLVQLAQAFSSFTAMIMGKKTGGGAGAAMKEVADAANSAAEATGGIEDAASGAEKAAKKAQKSLMGFDEINKLTSNTDANAGGGAGGSLFDDIEFADALAEQDKQAEESINKLMAKVRELLGLFKEGFKAGLGDDFEASLKRTKEHIEGIKKSLRDIFDSSVLSSIDGFANKLSYALGQVVGSAASIGQTIAELLIGGIDKALSQSASVIRERLVNIFDIKGNIVETLGNLAQTIASIFEVFRGDTSKQIIADLLSIFIEASLGITEIALKIGEDVINMIATPIIENKDKIKQVIEETLLPISTILSTLRESVEATFDKLIEVYDTKISPMFTSFTEGITLLVGALLDAWSMYISPILDEFATKFSEVWSLYVQPMLNSAVELIGSIAFAIKTLWETVLIPVLTWVIENVIPTLAPILEQLGNLFLTLLASISLVVQGIMQTLSGLIDFIVGVFTGDWTLAWEGIKNIFDGIWKVISGIVTTVWAAISGTISVALNAISSTIRLVFNGVWNFLKGIFNTIMTGVETLVNGIISGINKMIEALNALQFDIPSWVPVLGGKSFGFSIPTVRSVSLPRLAEGGYVRANQPQPVIIGDNKTQGEIVSPEDKMKEVMMAALSSFFSQLRDAGYGQSNNGNETGDIVIPIYLDGTLLDEVIVTAQQRRNIRSGGR